MTKIQVLGTGCAKCHQLAEHAETAAKEAGITYELEKITDINDIIMLGVMITPGLIIDGQIKVTGKVPSVDEIKAMF